MCTARDLLRLTVIEDPKLLQKINSSFQNVIEKRLRRVYKDFEVEKERMGKKLECFLMRCINHYCGVEGIYELYLQRYKFGLFTIQIHDGCLNEVMNTVQGKIAPALINKRKKTAIPFHSIKTININEATTKGRGRAAVTDTDIKALLIEGKRLVDEITLVVQQLQSQSQKQIQFQQQLQFQQLQLQSQKQIQFQQQLQIQRLQLLIQHHRFRPPDALPGENQHSESTAILPKESMDLSLQQPQPRSTPSTPTCDLKQKNGSLRSISPSSALKLKNTRTHNAIKVTTYIGVSEKGQTELEFDVKKEITFGICIFRFGQTISLEAIDSVIKAIVNELWVNQNATMYEQKAFSFEISKHYEVNCCFLGKGLKEQKEKSLFLIAALAIYAERLKWSSTIKSALQPYGLSSTQVASVKDKSNMLTLPLPSSIVLDYFCTIPEDTVPGVNFMDHKYDQAKRKGAKIPLPF